MSGQFRLYRCIYQHRCSDMQLRLGFDTFCCLQAFRNPMLAAVISHLQHAALTQPPAPRTAAVQALTKVPVSLPTAWLHYWQLLLADRSEPTFVLRQYHKERCSHQLRHLLHSPCLNYSILQMVKDEVLLVLLRTTSRLPLADSENCQRKCQQSEACLQVAVRSEEPYRLQCYSFLATLSNTHRASEPDTYGEKLAAWHLASSCLCDCAT